MRRVDVSGTRDPRSVYSKEAWSSKEPSGWKLRSIAFLADGELQEMENQGAVLSRRRPRVQKKNEDGERSQFCWHRRNYTWRARHPRVIESLNSVPQRISVASCPARYPVSPGALLALCTQEDFRE